MRNFLPTSSLPPVCIFLILFAVNFFGNSLSAQERMLTADEMRQDIRLLRTKLEKWHPNLYLKLDKKSIDNAFDELLKYDDPRRESEFFEFISCLNGLIRDGHLLFLPSLKGDGQKNAKVIPLHLVYLDNQLLLFQQYDQHPTIPRGSLILSINDEYTDAWTNNLLYCCMPVDANHCQYPSWILNQYFASYYSFFRGHPDSFIIHSWYQKSVRVDTVNALSWDSIAVYKRQEIPEHEIKGIDFVLHPGEDFAYLGIRDFHPEILRKKYSQHFENEIRDAFIQIQKENISNLVVDLRDNQGGKLEYGRLLLSYLIGSPFTMIEKYYKRSSHQPGKLKPIKGPCLRTVQPNPIAFKGQLYILINGGSFSNSSIVASCLQRNTNAIFMGEETGGNRQIMGGFTKTIVLPNSKIVVEIPSRRIVLDSSLPFANEGIKPDQEIKPTFEDLVNHIDPVMENALKRIQKKD